MTLLDAETGEAALAAYIRGGAFFRVLVPPGACRLLFATGKVWQRKASLFGEGVNVHSKVTRCDHLKLTHPGGVKAHRRAAPI